MYEERQVFKYKKNVDVNIDYANFVVSVKLCLSLHLQICDYEIICLFIL